MAENPPPYDPASLPEVRVDATNLRGLTHPLRLRALGLLRRNGPATASQLAAQMGESSGALSYHLRQLAAFGFVVDDEDREAGGRERWWRAAHRTTRYDDTDATPDQQLIGAEYLALVGRVYADRLRRLADRLPTMEAEVGPEYARAATMSDWNLRLSPTRAQEFRRAVEALVDAYEAEPDTGDDVLPVNAMFVLTPGRDA